MLGIMLRALLHCVIFTLLIPLKIVVIVCLVVCSTIAKIRGAMGYREFWGYVWQGMKETFWTDMDIIRNGF